MSIAFPVEFFTYIDLPTNVFPWTFSGKIHNIRNFPPPRHSKDSLKFNLYFWSEFLSSRCLTFVHNTSMVVPKPLTNINDGRDLIALVEIFIFQIKVKK